MSAQSEVSHEDMRNIYEEVKTPYKYGLAIALDDNYHKIDCPSVFREGGRLRPQTPSFVAAAVSL